MCGRVQIRIDSRAAAEAFQASVVCPPALFGRFNAAPSQRLPLLRPGGGGGGRELAAGTWGFPLGGGSGPRPINARSETALRKPAFREAVLRRRVALPVTGFYEWKKPDASAAPPLFGGDPDARKKAAWLIEAADGAPFALAAVTAPGAEQAPGFCVLTTRPNAAMAGIHDRMPVILGAAALGRWLDPATPEAGLPGLMEPVPAAALRFTPVSDRINKPAHEGPGAVEPVAESVPGRD